MSRKKAQPVTAEPLAAPDDIIVPGDESDIDDVHVPMTESGEPVAEGYVPVPGDAPAIEPVPLVPEPAEPKIVDGAQVPPDDPTPAAEPEADPEPPETAQPVSRVAQILRITTEKRLVSELVKFEESIYVQIRRLRELLALDLHSVEVTSIQNHMTEVERWREKVLRWSSLMKAFVAHCKSDHFILKRNQPGMKITEFDRDAYQKKLLAGFLGLDYYLEGLVETIDSRVNMAKVLLRLDEAGSYHPGQSQSTR